MTLSPPLLPPPSIQTHIEGKTCIRDTMGSTPAQVYKYSDGSTTLFLKVSPRSEKGKREYDVLKWLEDKLPVPRVIEFEETNDFSWLLMTAVQGEMMCNDIGITEPKELTFSILADAVKLLRSVDITSCPFDRTIATLKTEVDDYAKEGKITPDTVQTLFNKPPTEELVFSHGDCCLPNILMHQGILSGFIDLGDAGVADKWADLSQVVASIKRNGGDQRDIDLFFEYLNETPDWEKMQFFRDIEHAVHAVINQERAMN
ncbi:putative Aminoglycoside 3'-phosphotransferase [Blattamonas nauphoetae]|uniref:Aminoglycoside 3'-phosphotransferase n=1 Tax=Blattamonas nauphoetae TaxID=2049346 RepID=A0ABQ9X0K2_9EUKA|nr:putative Aminoglycoside 3'-phosphotransferase [Blattamonas nauphoetae]